MNTNEARVYFSLTGDNFNPDELTQFLGINPTSSSRKGSKIPGEIPKSNSWELSTENLVKETIDIYEMSDKIVKKLQPQKEHILRAIKQFNVSPKLQIVLWISVNENHSTPAIGFQSETIKFLSDIGASIDIDTYKH